MSHTEHSWYSHEGLETEIEVSKMWFISQDANNIHRRRWSIGVQTLR